MAITGHCLCGGVQIELTEPPLNASYCHCTRCQRRSGAAASAQARIAPGSLRLLAGEELVKSYEPPNGFAKAFCSNCGSALWSHDPNDADAVNVRLGLLDEGHGIRPKLRQFVAYAAEWEPLPDDGLPRFPERRPPDVG